MVGWVALWILPDHELVDYDCMACIFKIKKNLSAFCQLPFPSKEQRHRHSVCFLPHCEEYQLMTKPELNNNFTVSAICNTTNNTAMDKLQLKLYCANVSKECKLFLCTASCNTVNFHRTFAGRVEIEFDATCADKNGYIEVWDASSYKKRRRLFI